MVVIIRTASLCRAHDLVESIISELRAGVKVVMYVGLEVGIMHRMVNLDSTMSHIKNNDQIFEPNVWPSHLSTASVTLRLALFDHAQQLSNNGWNLFIVHRYSRSILSALGGPVLLTDMTCLVN